jgi:hypothetical protein
MMSRRNKLIRSSAEPREWSLCDSAAWWLGLSVQFMLSRLLLLVVSRASSGIDMLTMV